MIPFRKTAHGVRRVIFLLVLATILAFRCYTAGRTEWISREVKLQVEQLQFDNFQTESRYSLLVSLNSRSLPPNFLSDTRDTHEIQNPPGKLAETDSMDESAGESIGASDETPFDRMGDGRLQHYVPPHETAEDVTIVVAKAGEESTDWIYDFCDD